MKRTHAMDKRQLKLMRRLELVRSTVRVLTPTELEHVNGGTSADQQTAVEGGAEGCWFKPFTG